MVKALAGRTIRPRVWVDGEDPIPCPAAEGKFASEVSLWY